MALTAGTRLGVYDIIAPLGEGGMGQVFRARDTKLDRDVAIKILPDAFAHDADRLARFTREAKTLASLNHPHIASIYGLEESDGVTALVMELVEGDDLAVRLADGPISMDEALPIAKQIAEALEAAHEQGIVHRDLKPANIKIRPDGTVKVLDFGLAKAMEPAAAGSSLSASISPTITVPAMTQAGMILGTAAYMAPEQAKGRPAGKRSDVWAFGCVLYEMLTGRRAFRGEDVADTLAAVLRADPDWSAFPADVPPYLRTLVKRCLERDRNTRLPDLSVVRFMLVDGASSEVSDAASHVTSPAQSALPGRVVRTLPWLIAVAAVAAAVALWTRPAALPKQSTLRLAASPAANVTLAAERAFGSVAILSPDGATLALVGVNSMSTPQIFIRRLDRLEATALRGTDNATSPFFSPDGEWIGFFAEGKLKKVDVSGGAVVTVANAPNPRGGTWGEDETIVFAPDTSGGLFRVPAAGGKPEPVTKVTDGEVSHRWPQLIAGGDVLLYSASDSATAWSNANLVAQRASSGTRTILLKGGYYGRYFHDRYLVYMHEGVLFGAPLDIERLVLTGTPRPLVEGVATVDPTGGAQLALSRTGTLVYVQGQSTGPAAPIVWMQRGGQTASLRALATNWSNPHFSPDGSRLAMDVSDGTNTDVFVYDMARDSLTRVTFDPGIDQKPVWSPDGRGLVFSSSRGDKATLNLYGQRAEGAGDAQRLTDSTNTQMPGSWHPGGKYLAFTEVRPDTKEDVMILPMDGSAESVWKPGVPTVFAGTAASESEPMFSPDGRWIAYASNESGTNEVYVKPFPGPGGKWQVSTDGGNVPTWSSRRQELLFRSIAGRAMVVAYTVSGDSFFAEKPAQWSDTFLPTRPRQRYYDLHPDGERIAAAPGAATSPNSTPQDKVVFVFNFFDELDRLAWSR